MFNGAEQPKRGRGRPHKSKAPAAVTCPPAVPRHLLLSDDEDDDYQPNWAATGVGFSQVVRHIGVEANQQNAAPMNEKPGVGCIPALDNLADSRPSSASDVSLDMALLDAHLFEEKTQAQSSPAVDVSSPLYDLDSVQQPATNLSADGGDDADSDEENAPLEVDEGDESAVEDDGIPAASSMDRDDDDSFAALNTTAEEEEGKSTAFDDAGGYKSAEVEHVDIKLKVLRKRKEIAAVELKLLEKKARLYELKNAQ